MSDELYHYGTRYHSGRFPHGTGEDPHQRCGLFLDIESRLRKEGLSEKEIADYFGLSVKELRSKKSNARNQLYAANVATAYRLKQKGYSNVAIGNKMGVPESTVRNWLKPGVQFKASVASKTAEMLKDSVEENKYIDVGGGVENLIGISRTQLDNAIQILTDQGYKIQYIQTEQLGTGKKTSIKVLTKGDVPYSEVSGNRASIVYPNFYGEDGGSVLRKVSDPVSIDSKRIKIVYDEDGGSNKDGVIELRRGVEDISLGKAQYAQVRIAVDGTHYLKGMAMYGNDIPDGYDLVFYTSKKKGTPMKGEGDKSVLKQMKSSQDNPFGATIKGDNELILCQNHYIGKDGKEHQSALNIVNEEGNWSTWRKSLSSQMLSKQSTSLAKRQLKLAYDLKEDEYNDITVLENPVIKKKLLNQLADSCDSASVHLKAAGLPRQASKVILPITSLKENEVYAPSFRDGESVVLIRYPHAGTFEIPELVVNNKNKDAKSVMNNATDAIGINPEVAKILSGADFDGDTVLVIPTSGVKIKTSAPLKGLKDFDPKTAYPAYEGMIKTGSKGSGFNKQQEMGNVSNLITDMTIKGATPSEIAAAVRHSMVVIDAEKHNLNWRQSYEDNNIGYLKEKYQGGKNRGASTLISRASSEARPFARRETIDPNTGKKIYIYTGEMYTNKKGQTVKRTIRSTKMAETDDAYSLSSGSLMESIYAEHANKLKALANKCRKEALATKPLTYSPEAKKLYSSEVYSLNAKLNTALKNRPLERKAQLLAGSKVKIIRDANPDMDADDIKKLKGRALAEARTSTGAKKQQIDISDKEWEAIQAGAISTHKLEQIIDNSDLDRLKELATPRSHILMSDAKKTRARAMAARGYTLAEIADALGVSTSTIQAVLKE